MKGYQIKFNGKVVAENIPNMGDVFIFIMFHANQGNRNGSHEIHSEHGPVCEITESQLRAMMT